MIEFRCKACGREYKVSQDKAGHKGKCPNCHSVIIVPLQSDNQLIFDQKELTCREPRLQELYETLVLKMGNKIRNHAINEGRHLTFEIETDDYGTRSQCVSVGTFFEDENPEKLFFIYSKVGAIDNSDSAVLALRVAEAFPFANFALNDDHVLSVRMVADIDKSIETLWPHILGIALAADKLEDLLFSWDLQ